MADAAVRVDGGQPADVLGDLAAEVTLNRVAILDDLQNGRDVRLSQITGFGHRVNLGPAANFIGAGSADAVDVRKRDVGVFVVGNVYTENSWHV